MKFEIDRYISQTVLPLSGYTPGEQPSENGWIKLNTNELPYPPSPKVRTAILKELGEGGETLRLYPAPESPKLRAAAAKFYGLDPSYAFAGNGSDDILNLVVRAFSDGKKSAATIEPSYSLYPVLAKMQGSELERIPFGKDAKIPFEKIFASKANVFFFTNPNAPTGRGFDEKTVERIARGFRGIVLVDEAYAPFAERSSAKLVEKFDNLIVCGTSSKGWALAGMRVGWAFANPKTIEVLDRVRDSYNLDRLAQVAGVAALGDVRYHKAKVAAVVKERDKFEKFLEKNAWNFYKSSSNFVFFKPRLHGKEGAEIAAAFFDFMRGEKILMRYFPKEKSVRDGIRMTIGTPSEMKAVEKALDKWLKLESSTDEK